MSRVSFACCSKVYGGDPARGGVEINVELLSSMVWRR